MHSHNPSARFEDLYAHLSWIEKPLMIVLCSLLLGLVSQISIPMPSGVPLSLQSIAVIAMGLSLGSRLAVASIFLYLIEGAVGLPVFALGQSGLQVFAGPAAGFLLGFVPAAFIGGEMMRAGLARTTWGCLLSAGVALLVLYGCGLAWLSAQLNVEQALAIGLLPFLPFIPVKLVLLCASKWAWHR